MGRVLRESIGGIERKVVWGEKGGGRVGEEVQLVRGEIERVIGILKEEKAMERMGYRMRHGSMGERR